MMLQRRKRVTPVSLAAAMLITALSYKTTLASLLDSEAERDSGANNEEQASIFDASTMGHSALLVNMTPCMHQLMYISIRTSCHTDVIIPI